MFLQSDDHLIIMNLPTGLETRHGKCFSLTDEELRGLRDVGIRTVLNYSFWRIVEAKGYDYVDALVEQTQRLGMRCILGAYVEPADNLPEQCYCKQQDGQWCRSSSGARVLSLWSQDARALVLRHYEELIVRYGGPDVMVIHSGVDMGESPLPHVPCFYNDAALTSHASKVGGSPDISTSETQEWLRRSVVEHYLAVDEVLITQHNEVWQAIHPWLVGARKPWGVNGAFAQEDILRAEAERWLDATRVLLQYTYFHHHVLHSGADYKDLIDSWRTKYRLEVIVEANYCRGLAVTAPKAVARHLRGQIVGVVHPCIGVDHMRRWQIDAIAKAVRVWRAKRRGR